MKKLKQIIAILVIGTLLFTACDNRDEVEEISSCNYTFTATPATTNLEFSGATVTSSITLNITKQNSNVSCDSKYTMGWEVKKDGVSQNTDGFTYGTQNDMPIGNSTGTFTAIGIGTYTIEFTVTNTGADINKVQTETVTINVTYPPIVIIFATDSPTADGDEVFVTKDANYKFNVSGGNPSLTDYTAVLTRTEGDLGAAFVRTGGGGGTFNLGDNITVTNTNPIEFKITPETVGEATYRITITQVDSEATTIDFVLKSKAPEFDVVLRFGSSAPNPNDVDHPATTIDVSEGDVKNLKVKIQNFTSGFTGDEMNYTFAINEGQFVSNEHFSNPTSTTRGYPMPSSEFRYIIEAKPDGNGGYFTGVKMVEITVTNTEYGFSKTGPIWINIIP